MTTASNPWLPRASCDAELHADRRGAGRPARRGRTAHHAADACWRCCCCPALPLLAIPLPGRSHIQRGYCRLVLRCLGVRITVSGGPIRNLRGVLVVSGHVSWVDIFVDRRRAARFVRGQGRTDQLARVWVRWPA